jgi:transposase-like protein
MQVMDLKMNGTDNPSCPNCKHYNAMLPEPGYDPRETTSTCRDCGFQVIGKRLTGGAK